MKLLRIALLATVWVAAGCSSGGNGGSLRPASDQPNQSNQPGQVPDASQGAIGLPAAVLDPVIAEVARVSGVPVAEVVVQTAVPVTYPDGSLGCPLPGMAYTQVQVDGYQIVATAAGTTYDYRGSGPGNFRRCATPAG